MLLLRVARLPGDRVTKIVDRTLVLHGDRDVAVLLEDHLRIYRLILISYHMKTGKHHRIH